MGHLSNVLKGARITPDQLSKGMNMPIRSISYHFNTGRIPYALVYKMHLVTGIPMEIIIPKFMAEMWLHLLEEQLKVNKPKGKRKQNDWGKKEPAPVKHIRTLRERAEDKAPPVAIALPSGLPVPPKRKTVPRETEDNEKMNSGGFRVVKDTPPAKYSAQAKMASSKVEPYIPPAKHKPSIADLMKAKPVEPVPTEPEPDFTNVSDDLFSTSMANENNPVKRGKR